MSIENWQTVNLQEICTALVNGGTPPTNIQRYWKGTIPWITGADFSEQKIKNIRRHITSDAVQKSSTNVVSGGNILLVTRTGVGKIAIAPFDVAISQDITGIYFKDGIDICFVYFALQSHMEDLKKLNQGTSINGILKEDFLKCIFQLPTTAEQRKIAKILTTVDNLIEKTEALIVKYEAIKQGMMHDLFTRGVDENGRLRPSYQEAPELYNETVIGWVPKDWIVCRVDDIGSVQLGRQRSPKYQTGNFSTPYLRVANVFDGWIDYSDILEMDFLPNEREIYSVLPGDILLNEGQSIELVGRSATFLGQSGRYCFQNTLVRFRVYPPNDHKFYQNVLHYWFKMGKFRTVARQTTSVAHLGADRFAGMNIIRPKTEEQKQIAHLMSQKQKTIDCEKRYLEKARKIKTALMQDLLTGKVRVESKEGAIM